MTRVKLLDTPGKQATFALLGWCLAFGDAMARFASLDIVCVSAMVLVTLGAAAFFALTTRSWIWLALILLLAGACAVLVLSWGRVAGRLWRR